MFRRLMVAGLLWAVAGKAAAGFSSIYVFGDGVSNTNNTPSGGALNYYENRFCNGKVFVEVLAGWQGVTFDTTKNVSNFGNDSAELVTYANGFTDPGDAADSLFIVWANNADYVDFTANEPEPWTDPVPWNAKAATMIANHVTAITELYDNGARTIVMPNAVDVMLTPFYNVFREESSADYLLGRQRIINYNAQFKSAMIDLMALKPGLEIILPDTFAFFEQVLADPAAYGMINFDDFNTGGFDSGDPSLNGAGAQYVFWDDYHPTAKFQMHLAAFIQQAISPVKVNSLTRSGSNVHLQVANIPLGRDGVILGSANLQPPWAQDAVIDEDVNTTQSFVFPANGPRRFYRVAFPVVWTWP
jgi:phospholipase/lecithinase/hemolysin